MRYKWKAHYSDGTFLNQGSHQYEVIDRIKLIGFEVLDESTDKQIFYLKLLPKQRLIYRQVVFGSFNNRTKEQRELIRYWMVGWQMTVGGQNIQSLNYIDPDGKIIQADKFHHGGVQLRPEERNVGEL